MWKGVVFTSKFITAAQAAAMVPDGASIALTGNGGGIYECSALLEALEARFMETGHPNSLCITHAGGQGDKEKTGLCRLAHEGMVRRVIGGHWGWSPQMQKLAIDNKIEAYNLPLGIVNLLYREIAAHRPGVITQTGLKTFVDPRVNGAKLNDVTKEDIVELMMIDGKEWLRYKTYPINVAFIRGSIADEDGNISLEYEPAVMESLAIAQAAHNSGGKVIAQVKYAARKGTLNAKDVRVPGILVDAVVVEPNQWQTIEGEFNPALSGATHMPVDQVEHLPFDHRKIVARRAAMELKPGDVMNLGFGMPDGVAKVAAEEGFADSVHITLEQGITGGVPATGAIFGVAYNADAMSDPAAQFDFYSGGGLDMTCLGLAQADAQGNVNVSKFGVSIPGAGGFIDISQTAKACIFCGTFTAGGLKTKIEDGKLTIVQEGRNRKFVEQVEHITFSGEYAREHGQKLLFVTERAVFRMTPEGLVLSEVAPGIDIQKDVLDQMGFMPLIPEQPKLMDARIFQEGPMGMKGEFYAKAEHV